MPAVPVSGLTGAGLDDLMETVSTLAEVAELRAEAEGRAEGVVLESQVLQGRGCVQGVLREGAQVCLLTCSCPPASSPLSSSLGESSRSAQSSLPDKRGPRSER